MDHHQGILGERLVGRDLVEHGCDRPGREEALVLEGQLPHHALGNLQRKRQPLLGAANRLARPHDVGDLVAQGGHAADGPVGRVPGRKLDGLVEGPAGFGDRDLMGRARAAGEAPLVQRLELARPGRDLIERLSDHLGLGEAGTGDPAGADAQIAHLPIVDGEGDGRQAQEGVESGARAGAFGHVLAEALDLLAGASKLLRQALGLGHRVGCDPKVSTVGDYGPR